MYLQVHLSHQLQILCLFAPTLPNNKKPIQCHILIFSSRHLLQCSDLKLMSKRNLWECKKNCSRVNKMWELTFDITCKIYSALCCNQTMFTFIDVHCYLVDSVNFSTEIQTGNKTHMPGSHKLHQRLMQPPDRLHSVIPVLGSY